MLMTLTMVLLLRHQKTRQVLADARFNRKNRKHKFFLRAGLPSARKSPLNAVDTTVLLLG